MVQLEGDGRSDNPNVTMNLAKYYRSHPKRSLIFIVLAAVLIGLGIDVITAGIENHDDRVLDAQITESQSEMRLVGAQIAQMKDRDFESMAQYIQVYARIGPLVNDYDQKLQRYTDLYRSAEQRDQRKSLIHFWRARLRHQPEVWRDGWKIIDLARHINEITKKEVSVINDMSNLPESEQLQFWHEEFIPLTAEEHALREQLRRVGQGRPLQARCNEVVGPSPQKKRSGSCPHRSSLVMSPRCLLKVKFSVPI